MNESIIIKLRPRAFPQMRVNERGGYDIHGGMMLRDYFAAAMISSGHTFPYKEKVNTPELVAKQAYELADAMLKERENEQ